MDGEWKAVTIGGNVSDPSLERFLLYLLFCSVIFGHFFLLSGFHSFIFSKGTSLAAKFMTD